MPYLRLPSHTVDLAVLLVLVECKQRGCLKIDQAKSNSWHFGTPSLFLPQEPVEAGLSGSLSFSHWGILIPKVEVWSILLVDLFLTWVVEEEEEEGQEPVEA